MEMKFILTIRTLPVKYGEYFADIAIFCWAKLEILLKYYSLPKIT